MIYSRVFNLRLLAPLAFGATLAIAPSLEAQAAGAARAMALSVPDQPTCPECGIRIVPGVVIDEAATRALNGVPSAVAVDRSHRYWFLGADVPVVVDSTGRSVLRIPADRDPKEIFRHPYDVVAIGDSVVVVDPIARTAVVIGPRLQVVRQLRFEIPVTQVAVLKWPDALIGSGILATPRSIGWPLHRISTAGSEAKLESSFGRGDGQLRIGRAAALSERVAVDPHGGFWSYRRARYDLTRWDSAARAITVLNRGPSWFPPSDAEAGLGGPFEPPAPFVSGVAVDSAGLLWVYSSVPAETWASAWPAAKPGLVEITLSSVAFDRLFRSVIEVIDPAAKRVIVRSFVDGWIPLALPGRHAVKYSTDAHGRRQISIVSLEIDHGESRRE